MEEQEVIEYTLLLMMGVNKKPLTGTQLQKEIFILTKVKEDLREGFNYEKHLYGPFSQVLEESLESPSYLTGAFEFKDLKFSLSKEGLLKFNKMVEKYKENNSFQIFLSSLKLIRDLYDELENEELLFLIYETYPEYTEYSRISDELLKNKSKRDKITRSLLSKGIITEKRFEELKNG
jgi:uncharacterized protein YwgA